MDFDRGRVARRGPVQSLSINSPESSSDGLCNRSCLPVCLRFPARRAITVVYAVRGELGEQMSFESLGPRSGFGFSLAGHVWHLSVAVG